MPSDNSTGNLIAVASEIGPNLGPISDLSSGSGTGLGGGTIAGVAIVAAIVLVGFLFVLSRWKQFKDAVVPLLPTTTKNLPRNEPICEMETLQAQPVEAQIQEPVESPQGPADPLVHEPVDPQDPESSEFIMLEPIVPDDLQPVEDSQTPPSLPPAHLPHLPHPHPHALPTMSPTHALSHYINKRSTWPHPEPTADIRPASVQPPRPQCPQIIPRNPEYGHPLKYSYSGKTPLSIELYGISGTRANDASSASPTSPNPQICYPLDPHLGQPGPSTPPNDSALAPTSGNLHSVPPRIDVSIPGSPAFGPGILIMGAPARNPHGEATVSRPQQNTAPVDVVRKPRNGKERADQ
ncbi:hypothetical protein BG005_001424 [Podila minutissima]|nr:hypothetical protein BG005_001424 [Podila minutissima]